MINSAAARTISELFNPEKRRYLFYPQISTRVCVGKEQLGTFI